MKWTQSRRVGVFSTIANTFGPWNKWGRRSFPANRKEEYDCCLDRILENLNKTTRDKFEIGSLKQQISMAISVSRNVKNSIATDWILCKAAAIESGLLRCSDLPTMNLDYGIFYISPKPNGGHINRKKTKKVSALVDYFA